MMETNKPANLDEKNMSDHYWIVSHTSGGTITNIARDYNEFRVSMEKHTWEKKHDLDGVGTSLQGTMSLG